MKDFLIVVLTFIMATPLILWPIALIWASWRREEWKIRFMEQMRKEDPNFKYPFKD